MLTPYQLLTYLRAHAEIERSALGIDTLHVQGEVDELSMEQLKRNPAGEDPARVLGAE